VYVLVVGIGLPIPVDPLFLLMGAQAGDHRYSFFLALLVSMSPALLGDVLWYQIGKYRGRSVLSFLCKVSLEPDTCVRKTESAFSTRGSDALLFAKFVPGMSLVSVTLAGISRMRFWRFLLADAAGCALWAGSYLLLGWLFHKQVDKTIELLGLYGRRAGLVIVSILALYLAYKYVQRRRFIRNLRIDRITPEQVRALLDNGQPVTIVDLRHSSEVERVGIKIPSALVLRPEDLRSRSHEIPREHEIILYCT
jgi:membrane protein DedA with SNARE-associated domain